MNTNRTEIFVFQGSEEISEFLIAWWKKISGAAVKNKKYFTAALSGGKTPVDFYIKLSELKDKALWEKTHIFLADERDVPVGNPDSNYGLLLDTLLSKIPVPRQNIHPVHFEPDNPELSALKYEDEIKRFFRVFEGESPVFDLILLGVGTDGHTASLFPGDKAVKETISLSVFVILDKQRHNRITFTLPLINRAENIIILATGTSKAEIIKRVIVEKDSSLPAALIRPENGRLIFLLDSAAASGLPDSLKRISGTNNKKNAKGGVSCRL